VTSAIFAPCPKRSSNYGAVARNFVKDMDAFFADIKRATSPPQR
jgi:hypothetical protein